MVGTANEDTIILQGRHYLTLVDSGSVTSTISRDLVKELDLPIIKAQEVIEVEGFTGNTLILEDIVAIDIHLPVQKYSAVEYFFVAPATPYSFRVPFICGTPIIDRVIASSKAEGVGLNWAPAWERARLGRQPIEEPQTGFENIRLKTMRRITIPPRAKKNVRLKGTFGSRDQKLHLLVEPLNAPAEGVTVAPAYTDLSPSTSVTRLVVHNHTSKVMTIPRGKVYATASLANYVPAPLVPQLAEPPMISHRLAKSPEQSTPAGIEAEQFPGIFEGGEPEHKNEDQEDREWMARLDLGVMGEWTEEQQCQAREMLQKHKKVFALDKESMGKTTATTHKIRMADDTPIKQGYRRIPPHLLAEVRKAIEEMLSLGVIVPTDSPWSSPVVLARKKDGALRMCIDLRMVNSRTTRDAYSLPRIEETLDTLSGSSVFTSLDLKWGYWQVPMEAKSRQYTAFTVGPLGFYECVRMPFGLTNAPATFQRLMQTCLGGLHLTSCIIYLDDVVVYARTVEEHLERLDAVLTKIGQAGLKLKPNKCEFFRRSLKFLGHIVSGEGIATSTEKVDTVRQWSVPKTVKEVKSFLGFVSYYRRFIPEFAAKSKPLQAVITGPGTSTRRDGKNKVLWNTACQTGFEELRDACCTAPILAYPDFDRKFILHTDASVTGLGAALYQKHDEVDRVIAYASRVLTPAETNYPAHKLEFLALKWAVTKKFREYLLGAPFEVYTDNNPLLYAMRTAKLDATSSRWVAELSNYEFAVSYRAGRLNADADALSRLPWPECMHHRLDEDDSEALLIACIKPTPWIEAMPLSQELLEGMEPPEDRWSLRMVMKNSRVVLADDWAAEQTLDPEITAAYEGFIDGIKPTHPPKRLKEMRTAESRFLLRNWDAVQIRNDVLHLVHETHGGPVDLIVVPKARTADLVKKYHRAIGHLRGDRTVAVLRERFTWNGLWTQVRGILDQCGPCRRATTPPERARMVPIVATYPMDLLHMDYLTLDKRSGFEDVLILTDHFTRYAQAIPTRSQSAPATVKALMESFVYHYGLPRRILTDQGKTFEGKMMKLLCKALGIRKIRTTPYHPQGNGQCERFNQTLIKMIKTSTDPTQWPKQLSALAFAYNNTPHAATGYSPYFLMHGRQQSLPVDLELGVFPGPTLPVSKERYVDMLKRRLVAAFDAARAQQAKPHHTKKDWYNRKARAAALQVGDLVYVREVRLRGRHKLESNWERDCYEVVAQSDPEVPVFKVRNQRTKALRTLHRNLLLPVRARMDENPEPVTLPAETDDPPRRNTRSNTVLRTGGSSEHTDDTPDAEEETDQESLSGGEGAMQSAADARRVFEDGVDSGDRITMEEETHPSSQTDSGEEETEHEGHPLEEEWPEADLAAWQTATERTESEEEINPPQEEADLERDTVPPAPSPPPLPRRQSTRTKRLPLKLRDE